MSTARSTVEAGLLIRGHVRRQLRGKAHALGLALTIDEDKGLLASTFLVTVYGSKDSDVAAFVAWLEFFTETLE